MLPNFIIVGAPKAGTTSLYQYLSGHPEVFMSTPKEVNYFSSSEIKEQNLYYDSHSVDDLSEYIKLFTSAKASPAVGEGSVSYLYYPKTPFKIKKLLPDVKIIILLRDPVERAFSHYLMDHRLGLVTSTFKDIVYQRKKAKNDHLYFQQYISLGMYYEQVKRYLDLFGEKQVKIYLQEDLRHHRSEVTRDLYQFLEISDLGSKDTDQEHNSFSMPKNKLIHKMYSSSIIRAIASFFLRGKIKSWIEDVFFERKNKPELHQSIKNDLYDLYDSDINKLSKLINRDLSNWAK